MILRKSFLLIMLKEMFRAFVIAHFGQDDKTSKHRRDKFVKIIKKIKQIDKRITSLYHRNKPSTTVAYIIIKISNRRQRIYTKTYLIKKFKS